MDILVIGNGFDIAHGLPTKYKEFLEICSLTKLSKIMWCDGEPNCVFDNRDEEKEKLIHDFCLTMGCDLFEEFRKIVTTNFWISSFAEREKIVGPNWIDFENEIKKTLEALYADMLNSKSEYVTNVAIHNAHIYQFCNSNNLFKDKSTYRKLFEKLLIEHKRLIRALELYMDGYINKLNVKKLKYISNIKVDKVISFNYTAVYENNYNKNDVEFCYIHGKANINKTDSNIVLGFDDHYIADTKQISELIPFEKYYQRIVKNNDSQYIDWRNQTSLQAYSDPIKNLFIYGHSLGISDGDVLRDLILYRNVKTTIYFYDEFDRADKIKNLALILGPDNLIRLTGGAYPYVIFETD